MARIAFIVRSVPPASTKVDTLMKKPRAASEVLSQECQWILDGRLLSRLGKLDAEPAIAWAKNDEDACRYMKSDDWEAFLVEEGNSLRDRIRKAGSFSVSDYNSVAGTAKDIIQTPIFEAIECVNSSHETRKMFKDQMSWDLIHIVMEHAYNEIVPPGWFTLIERAYIAGHIVCGREGINCDGNLVLY
ncbi:MAG: hypothetical protein HEQ23_15230 [Tepidisphaera sp.]